MGKISTPISDLIDRLTYHTTADQMPQRMLDGWKFEAVPVASVEGLADLPAIRLYIPDVTATFRPTRHETTVVSVRMIVATKRDDGLVALIQKIELVMDAVNTGTDGFVKRTLAGCLKPFSWNAGSNFIVDNSLNAQVSISLEPAVIEIGQRRL